MTSYDRDLSKWAQTQASLLLRKKFDKLDIDHLVEELNSLGKSDRRALRSYLVNIILHLLKQKFQPEKATSSWQDSINHSRREIRSIWEDEPSLKKYFESDSIFEKCYTEARREAAKETRKAIKNFPGQCPWELKEIL